MNILIIGGLVLVALIAVVGLTILIRMEAQDKARSENLQRSKRAQRQVYEQPRDKGEEQDTSRKLLSSQSPTHTASTAPTLHLDHQYSRLQLELRSLQQDLRAFEQRLETIAQMASEIEQEPTGRVHVEEHSVPAISASES